MQVRRIGLFVVFALWMTGCGGNGSLFGTQSTNNGTQGSGGDCTSQSTGRTLSVVPNRFIVEWMDGHFSVETSENAALFKKRFLDSHPNEIRRVEYDQVVQVRGQKSINPPLSNFQTWGPTIVGASAAYAQNVTGAGVLVAVVDAAVDYTQPQLARQLAANSAEINGVTGVDDDGNGFVDDYYGWDFQSNTNNPRLLVGPNNEHGTHVSGIIAADPTQGPVQGVAPGAKLIPVNFMTGSGTGLISDAMIAVQYAVSRGAKIINASWGGSQCSQSLKNMMVSLSTQNILFVVAAGNSGEDIGVSPDYPANFNFANQLNVASTNSNDFMDSFSNYSTSLVHLAAPGDTIFSTVPGATQGYMSGTSMAAPFVSGAAALLWSSRPKATVAQVKSALLAGVDQRGLPTLTAGRLNIGNSLKALQQIASP